jgi:hypothetical protein
VRGLQVLDHGADLTRVLSAASEEDLAFQMPSFPTASIATVESRQLLVVVHGMFVFMFGKLA